MTPKVPFLENLFLCHGLVCKTTAFAANDSSPLASKTFKKL